MRYYFPDRGMTATDARGPIGPRIRMDRDAQHAASILSNSRNPVNRGRQGSRRILALTMADDGRTRENMETMTGFKKHCRIGTVPEWDTRASFWVTIEFKDGKLSMTGVVGPKANGDCRGSCGQTIMGFKEYDARGYMSLTDITSDPGWNAESIRKLMDAWDEWHNNDLQAGCEHQRAEGWNERPIDPSKPTTAYGKHHPNQRHDSWNMLTWVKPDEVPGGLMTAPCPVCGYKYGTAWLRKEVPTDVVEWLQGLPESEGLPDCWAR